MPVRGASPYIPLPLPAQIILSSHSPRTQRSQSKKLISESSSLRATSRSEQRSSSHERRSKTVPSHNGSVYEPVTRSGTSHLWQKEVPSESSWTAIQLSNLENWQLVLFDQGSRKKSQRGRRTELTEYITIDITRREGIGARPASASRRFTPHPAHPHPPLHSQHLQIPHQRLSTLFPSFVFVSSTLHYITRGPILSKPLTHRIGTPSRKEIMYGRTDFEWEGKIKPASMAKFSRFFLLVASHA